MSIRPLALLGALLLLALAAPASAGAAVHLSQIGSFNAPVYVTAPPGDPHRVMVVEQGGRIEEVLDGSKLATPFLDISSSVLGGGEMGLLSMAFAPDYATSGKFYVYFTAPLQADPNGDLITVEEFTRAAGNPNAADPAGGRVLMTIDHPGQQNHNGGQLQFGPDGFLYAGTGDGGGANDQGSGRPPNNAQSLGSNLGKLLRIDPVTGANSIYAYGLRNPWRFSFDRQTSDLVIADVGQGVQEEVDFAPAGTGPNVNYGWVCWEGTRLNTQASPPCNPQNAVMPVLTKNHTSDGFCAIVGGYVVRDPALGGLAGRYIYGDHCATAIRSVALAPSNTTGDSDTGMSVQNLSSFGEDSCGHLYAASLGGPVYRIDGDAFTPCPEGPSDGAPPPPGVTQPRPADTTAPLIRLSARRIQRLLRQHGVRIAVSCNELCGASASGKLLIARSSRVYALETVTRQLGANRRTKVALKLSRRAVKAIRTALARHRRVTASLLVIARDPTGNQSRRAKSVTAKR